MDTVLYDSDCGVCNRVRRIVEALDWLGTMRWVPNRSAEAERFGIPQEHLDHAVYLISDGRQAAGFRAVQRVLTRLPLAWMIAALVVAKRPWTAVLFAFLLSPIAEPVGQPAYDWVARNRYRLPGSTCDTGIK